MLRPALAVLVLAVLVLLPAGPAGAHVDVSPSTAPRGGYAALSFRVPNERDGARTVRVQVVLPPDAPLASVTLAPVPGWTGAVTKGTLPRPVLTAAGEVTQGVTSVTWAASSPAAGIAPGQARTFTLTGGPFPDRPELVLKTLQTYSTGEVVRWIEEPTDGQEPDLPAPVVALTPARGAGGDAGSGGSAAPPDGGTDGAGALSGTASPPAAPAPAPARVPPRAGASGATRDGGAGSLPVAGLVAGLAGLGLAGGALAVVLSRRRQRRTGAGSPGSEG